MDNFVLQWAIKHLPFNFLSAYYIGFIDEKWLNLPTNQRFSKIKWVKVGKYGKEGWFADPFIYKIENDIATLFAEEMLYSTNLGRLVEMTVDLKTLKITSLHVILELNTHLSFPIFFHENGKVFIYPENYQSGTLTIWEYNEQTHKLTNPQELIAEKLQDSQLLKYNGNYYVFATICKTCSIEDDKDLYIYKSDSLLGNYELVQTIKNTKKEERGAGSFILENDRIIRPAQICNETYGEGVILYDISIIEDKFKESELQRILPDSTQRNGRCLHTFNKCNGLCVVDGKDYIYPKTAKFYFFLKNLPFFKWL